MPFFCMETIIDVGKIIETRGMNTTQYVVMR
jgi:hypothetical protein